MHPTEERADPSGSLPASGPEGHVGLSVGAIRLLRLGIVVAFGGVFGLLYGLSAGFRAEVREATGILASGDVGGLGEYILSYGAWAPVASTFLMVLQALAAPLPSFVLTFANGLAFGTFWGWALSLFGHTLAAAVCFWISRSLGRVPVEVVVGKGGLESADRWFARWGLYAVVIARLVPGISFDVVSYAAGITHMSFRRFLGATALGVFPQTLVYSYLGHRAPENVRLFLLSSTVILAGVLVAALIRRRRRTGTTL